MSRPSPSQLSAVFTGGMVVRYHLTDHIYARADFVDYISQFPSKVFALAPGATGRGIFHQFTPTIGITFRP